MSRDEVLAKLRQHAPELQAEGILHLALFGSTARNEADEASDVDLMADYDPEKKLSLLDIAGLHLQLEDLLGAKVDLCTRNLIKPILKPYVEADAVDAF
ncbi:nucleotidyltransferase family protein [Granulicella paludicola]|uniref:nucleotidyltransferase family protein n=1 Tax=Granulicella paludicola TaxID=474951 RepID=UPI0021DFD7E1|nr:nucleotidyltransferase family protein [Granulicella paludicola]